MPTLPELVYAALLYKDGESSENPESKDFASGTETEDGKLIFSFQKPDDTSGKFTLEIFAFKADTTQFSRSSAPFSKAKKGLAIVGDAINVSETIVLEVNDSSDLTGTVSLRINVPTGCSLTIDDTTNFNCEKDEASSDTYVLTQKDASGISAGAYPLTFTVKKGEEIVHIFSEYINVINGLCTDTWWNGEKSSEVKEITQSMISSTVYVRGAGGWYDGSDYKDTATANDTNSGSLLSPLATIQKAIDKIIAINDGTTEYTIYVDGTLTQGAAAPMATFSALKKELTLTIKALSGIATLDGGARLNEDGTVAGEGSKTRIITASHGTNGILKLTLENLVITGGNTTVSGGGIYMSDSTLKMKDCTVEGNAATDSGGGISVSSGELTMERCAIKGNLSKSAAGGVCFDAGTLTTEKCVFSGNISKNYGGAIYICKNAEATMTDDEIKENTGMMVGGIYVYGSALEMKNCKVEGNIATSYGIGGIGVFSGGTVTMDGGTISRNEVRGKTTFGTNENYGGGVCVYSGSKFTMKGDATISENILSESAANRLGCEVRFNGGGTFEMEGGTISGGNAKLGGGVYVDGSASNFNMSGGTITGNAVTANGGGVYVKEGTFTMTGGTIGEENAANTAQNGGGVYVKEGTFTMTGGTISGNTATTQGSGVYIAATNSAMGTFNMSGAAKIAEDNDVYLYASGTNIPTITVAGALTAASPVATITPSAYTAGTQVLSADSGVTIDDTICGKFAVSQEGWGIVPDGTGANGVLKAVINVYVRGSGEGWYMDNGYGDITGSDNNSGDRLHPFATIQKAIDEIIA